MFCFPLHTLCWVLMFGLVIAGSSFPVKNWASGISHAGRLHTRVRFLFCLHFREDFACKDSGGRREEAKGCRSTRCQWQSWLSAIYQPFLKCLVFAAFISKRRRAGQCELCSWQQLRFWHHLPPNPLPRKGLTFVCMCVHTSPPHPARHHFSRLTLISSPATFLCQELAFDDVTSFLPPALDFPDSVWHTGGRHFSVFYLAWLAEVLDLEISFFFLFFLQVMNVRYMDFFCKSSRKQNRCKMSVSGSLDSW